MKACSRGVVTAAVALLALLPFRLSAVASGAVEEKAGAPAKEASPSPNAAALYADKCAICHGADGAPKPVFAQKGVPNMKAPEWQKARTDAQVRQSILEGKEGTMMSPYKEKLSPAEIESLVAYIRSFAPAK